jgi:hypothetical protein
MMCCFHPQGPTGACRAAACAPHTSAAQHHHPAQSLMFHSLFLQGPCGPMTALSDTKLCVLLSDAVLGWYTAVYKLSFDIDVAEVEQQVADYQRQEVRRRRTHSVTQTCKANQPAPQCMVQAPHHALARTYSGPLHTAADIPCFALPCLALLVMSCPALRC